MKVVAIRDSSFVYYKNGGIKKYGLTKGKWYQVANANQIAPATNRDEFIHIFQIDGKVIPHSPEDFLTPDEWREMKLKELGIRCK